MGGPLAAHAPATPVECVADGNGGQCVNYVADHANGPNLHACPAGEGGRPGDGPGGARTRAVNRKRTIRDWSYGGDVRT